MKPVNTRFKVGKTAKSHPVDICFSPAGPGRGCVSTARAGKTKLSCKSCSPLRSTSVQVDSKEFKGNWQPRAKCISEIVTVIIFRRLLRTTCSRRDHSYNLHTYTLCSLMENIENLYVSIGCPLYTVGALTTAHFFAPMCVTHSLTHC